MTEVRQIYKCNVCGNVVEMLHGGSGQLVCCNQPMQLLEEKTKDEGSEKHVPIMEKSEDGVKVKVGSVPHPMEENHYVEWIELHTPSKIYRKQLKPGGIPEATFAVKVGDLGSLKAREYCNLHEVWITYKLY